MDSIFVQYLAMMDLVHLVTKRVFNCVYAKSNKKNLIVQNPNGNVRKNVARNWVVATMFVKSFAMKEIVLHAL